MPSRRRKASDRSERNRERSEKWVRESEGIKDHQCSNQGASLKKKKRASVSCDCALACMHTPAWYLYWCVRESLHVVADKLGCASQFSQRGREHFVFF